MLRKFINPLELSTVNGANGFRVSGYSVASAGDVNGDGISDLIIGTPEASPESNVNAGSSYVVFGSLAGFKPTLGLSTLDGTNGFRINGEIENDKSGTSVASAGDVNGDGISDLIIGAPYASPGMHWHAGTSYVIFGSRAAFNPTLELSTLGGANGFRINGVSTNDKSGSSVASAGDINGDGISDLIIEAPRDADPVSYVVFGSRAGFNPSFELSALNGVNGFRINVVLPRIDVPGGRGYTTTQIDTRTASAGDINGDGINDLIIGVHSYESFTQGGTNWAYMHSRSSASRRIDESYVVFGSRAKWNASLDLSALNGANGFRISGQSVPAASAGDINGDGISDLIIGIPDYLVSYVVFGSRTEWVANVDLAIPTLNSPDGFCLNSPVYYSQSAGNAGDINNDGISDLIIGGGGVSYVVFGNRAGFSACSDLVTLNGRNGFKINDAANNRATSVASAGDVNGDGISDLIIGVPAANVSYVVFGGPAFLAVPSPLPPTSRPTVHPTFSPTLAHTFRPTLRPTSRPTPRSTLRPTLRPTSDPTLSPIFSPTLPLALPTPRSISRSTFRPTFAPMLAPSWAPSSDSQTSSTIPMVPLTFSPSQPPSSDGQASSSISMFPSTFPSRFPQTLSPTLLPSQGMLPNQALPDNSEANSSLPGIIGGVVGGLVALIGLSSLAYCFKKRATRKANASASNTEDTLETVPLKPKAVELVTQQTSTNSRETTVPPETSLVPLKSTSPSYGSKEVPVPPSESLWSTSRSPSSSSDEVPNLKFSFTIQYEELQFGPKLGEGGFGTVFQAQYRNNPVAVKQLRISQPSASSLKEFQKEMTVMANLRCPQVVQFYGVYFTPAPGIVMEYMPQGSLYQVIYNGQPPLPWNIRLQIARDITCGLSFLHHEDIIHRDLKSLNVLLNNEMHAKLTDFGLAKIKTESISFSNEKPAGTLLWMAPELFKRASVCTRESDVYSLGITLWELAAYKRPFEDAQNPAIAKQWIESGEREPIPQDCHPQLAKAITWCWMAEAAKRPSAKQVLELLDGSEAANESYRRNCELKV